MMISYVMEMPGYLSYIFTIVVLAVAAHYWKRDRPTAKLPLINPKAWFDICNFQSRSNYVLNAPRILEDGITRVCVFLQCKISEGTYQFLSRSEKPSLSVL